MKNNNEVRKEIEDVIKEHYEKYKLPPMDINDKEWDAFYSIIYDHLKNKEDYIDALNIVIRSALSYASFNDTKTFNINHLIKAIDDLVAFKIYSEEREIIKDEIYKCIDKENNIDKNNDRKTILEKAINDSKKNGKEIPEFITYEDWMVLFDVFEAHYLINGYMENYPIYMYWFIKEAISYYNYVKEKDIKTIFKKTYYCDSLDSISNVVKIHDGEAVIEEINERLDKNKRLIKSNK